MKFNINNDISANKGSEFAQKFKNLVWEFPEVEKVYYLDGVLTIDVQEGEKQIINNNSKYVVIDKNNYKRTTFRELMGKKEFVIFVNLQTCIEPFYLTMESPSKKRSSFSFDSVDGSKKLYESNFFSETVKQAIEAGESIYLFESKVDVLNFLIEDDLKKSNKISTTSIFVFRYFNEVYSLVYVEGGWGFQSNLLTTEEVPILFYSKTPFLSDYIRDIKSKGLDLIEFKNYREYSDWVNAFPATVPNSIIKVTNDTLQFIPSFEPSENNIICILDGLEIYKLGENEAFGVVDFYSKNGVSYLRESFDSPDFEGVIKAALYNGCEVFNFKDKSIFLIWEELAKISLENSTSEETPVPTNDLLCEPKLVFESLSKHKDFIDSSNAAMFFMVRREFLKKQPNKHFIIENENDGELSHYELVKYDYHKTSGTEYWGFKNLMKSGLNEEIKHCENLWTNSVREAVEQGETVFVLTYKEYCEWLGIHYPEPPTEVQDGVTKSNHFTGISEEIPFIGFKFNEVPFRLVNIVGTYGFQCLASPNSSLLFKENLLSLKEYVHKLSRLGLILTRCDGEKNFQEWLAGENCLHYSFLINENSGFFDETGWSKDSSEIVLIHSNNSVHYLYNSDLAHGDFFYFISSSITEPNLFPEKTFTSPRDIIEYAVEQGHQVLRFNNKGAHKIWLQILESKNPPMSLYPELNELEEQLVEASSAVEDFEHNVKAKLPWDSTKICAYEREGEVFKLVQEVDKLFPNYCNNFAFVSLKDCFLPSSTTYLTSPEECINEVTSWGHRVYEFETEENFKLWAAQVINISLERKLKFLSTK